MYTTEIYRGTAFQSYVPKPIYPCLVERQTAMIERLQCRLAGAVDAAAFRTAMLDAVVRHEDRPEAGPSRRARVEEAIDLALQCKRFDARSLKAVNAILVGRTGQGFRNGPIWIAAGHPALSTHVGSPVARLESLVSQILAIQDRPGPVVLRALVAMVRLLQVHPFPDGNGRTARLLACWWMSAGLGRNPAIPLAIARLWRGGTVGINQMCVAARDVGDWDPLLDAFLDASTEPRSSALTRVHAGCGRPVARPGR